MDYELTYLMKKAQILLNQNHLISLKNDINFLFESNNTICKFDFEINKFICDKNINNNYNLLNNYNNIIYFNKII